MTDNRPAAWAAGDGQARAAGSRAGAGGRADANGAWRLNVLGPVELCYDGVPVEVAGPTRALLALLARTPCEEVDTASIVAAMWGSQPPEDSEIQVASHVARLRKALTAVAPTVDPTSVVVTLPTGYVLAIQPSNADILTFERLLADGRRAIAVGQPALALRQLDAALTLWRGKAYEDYSELAFARAEADRLEELRLSGVESRVDALLALHAPAVPANLLAELQQLTTEHWHRERLWGQLMTVLVRLGRRSDALAVHRRAQEELAQRLRVQPGAELRSVEEAVIDRDPRLFGVPLQQTTVPAALAVTVPPCHGREQEIDWLCAAMDLASTRRAQARLIVGSPGMGKSRLIAEVAQRAAERGAVVRYWRADARGLETHVAEPDRLSVIILEDLDQAQREDVARVVSFVRSAMTRPVVTYVTCRDPVRVGDLASVPKLVLSALDDAAIVQIVHAYAPSVAHKTAVSAMANTGGVPAKVHRAASEWAFARAGRRIDRAVAEAVEPRRTLSALRDEVVAGALELAHVRARARALRPTVRTPGCPYPGLAGFGPSDVELFHGRERLVAQTLAKLADAPLLALIGDAGAGKTSLLRAGVLPAITAGVLPDSSRWRQVVVTPSTVASLADLMAPPPRPAPVVPEIMRSSPLTTPTALIPIAGRTQDAVTDDDGGAPADDPGDEVADFAPAPPSVHSGVDDQSAAGETEPPAEQVPVARRNGILPTGAFTTLTPTAGLPALRLPLQRTTAVDVVSPGASRPPAAVPSSPDPTVATDDAPEATFLVVDQFEEVFVLLDEQRRAEFIDALVAATTTGKVLVSMRSDFYQHCARYPELAALATANTLAVTPMVEEELRRAIVRPAEIAGLEVEPGLVDRLVAEVEDGYGGLAELAIALRELWHGRSGSMLTLAAYQSGPGLAAAIEAYAEGVFARMPTPQARSAARVLLAGLVALTEDRLAVRARVNLTELLSRAGAGALPALEVLTAGGLVTVTPDIDAVELRHDCLLAGWPRLREALDDTAAETSMRRHLRRAAAAWSGSGRTPAALYKGARLVAILDWAERNNSDLSTVEREFLAAGQRALLATETRRKRRTVLLWRWLAATLAVAILATAVATISVVMNIRTTAAAQRADAARLGVQALAEPDLRLSLLLAVAATRLDSGQIDVLRTALERNPDLIAVTGAGISTVAVSPDGNMVAAATTAGPVLLLSGDTRQTVATLDYPQHGPVNGLAFTPDGRRLVSWGGSRTSADADAASIVVWDLESRRPTGTAFGQAWPDAGGGILSDDVTLVLAQRGVEPQSPATVVAWNIDARTPSTAFSLPTSTVDSLVVAGDGRRLAYGASGDTIVLTLADGRSRILPGASTPLAFSPNGQWLLAASGAQLFVWDLAAATPMPRTVLAHREQVLGAAWAPDGASFATVGTDGSAVIWSLDALSPLRSFNVGTAPMTGVSFTPDARTLITVGAGGAVLAFDLSGSQGLAARLTEARSDSALVALACGLAGRGLTVEEWKFLLPDRPFQHICP